MKISVLTTSYNYEKYISQTIESVLNQTYTDFEYIIFDDGSTDNSVNIIKEYAEKDKRIKFYTHENNSNKGLIQTLKSGIEKCSGDWIIFVESDDYISPDYIVLKINALNKIPLPEQNNIALVFNDIIPLYSQERLQYLDKYLSLQKKLIAEKSFKQFELMEINIIPTFSCVMARKNVLQEIIFQFNVPKCFDWYLWNSILIKYPALYIDKKLTTFRLHNQSYTMKKNNMSVYRGLLDIGQKKYPKLNLLYFLFCLYRNNVRFEKMFRPFVKITSRFIYKNLYVQNTVKIITEKN